MNSIPTMNKEDDVRLMMHNFTRLKKHLRLNYIKFLQIVLQRRYHNIDNFIESDIFGLLSENSQKKIKERKCFDLSIPVLCKLLMEDTCTGDKEKNEDIKSVESIWRTHISENDDEMISSKIMQQLIERLNRIGERMVLRFPDVGEPHETNIQRFSPEVNENLVSTEKFESENQLQDENDDPPIVIHQFGDNNKIIFKLEDRRQLEVQSSVNVRVVLRSSNSEAWKAICDEIVAINLDDLNSNESIKESHITVTSIERGCVVLNFNTNYAHPIKGSINRLLDAMCQVLDVEEKMQKYNVPLLQVRGYIYYPEKFTKVPNSRTCPNLSIICHLSWINSTTNCDVDIYVTSLMRNLIENNFSTDADEQIELQIKWYVNEKQECDITPLSYDVKQLLSEELRRMHLKIKEISENEKTINLSFKCTEQVAYVNFIGEGGIVSNITKVIFGNAWTSHWQLSVFLDTHVLDDSVTCERLKISISPMPKDLKAITKNNLSKVISAMLEGKGAAQPNSIGDLKIKAIIDYQEDKPMVNLTIIEQPESVIYGNSITLKAEVEPFLDPSTVTWTRCKKGNKEQITHSSKFFIDNSDTRYPKLLIDNLDFNDNGQYVITVTNALGTGSADIEIKVGVREMIFISGPVAVFPSNTIEFQTFLPFPGHFSNPQWLKIENNIVREIKEQEDKNQKYFITKSKELRYSEKLEIVDAGEEDSATYQLSFGTMKSNKIRTFVDGSGVLATEKEGNFFRFLALISISANAMRKAFDNFQYSFKDLLKMFEHKARRHQQTKLLSHNLRLATSSKDLDIPMMYAILRNTSCCATPSNGWGRPPKENDIGLSDDIERIRHYQQLLHKGNILEMDTTTYNTYALDLIWAIRRLSMGDVQLIEDVCDVMNKVYMKGESLEKMDEEFKLSQYETGRLEQPDQINATNLIFISGPVVVRPSDTIQFQTVFWADQKAEQEIWWKEKNHDKEKIQFSMPRFTIYLRHDKTKITKMIEIANASEDDSATYSLSLHNRESNKILTIVDDSGFFATENEGNFFRFFNLQSVSADAMRIAFDKLPGVFEEKIEKFKRYCMSCPRRPVLLLQLKEICASSSRDLNITLMYAMFRAFDNISKPKNGWGRMPCENALGIADDIERIRFYRNFICHTNANEMKTGTFNDYVLDLIGAIRRLTMNDVQLMKNCCDIMNKVFIKGESLEKTKEELKLSQEETEKWEKLTPNKESHEDTQLKYKTQ